MSVLETHRRPVSASARANAAISAEATAEASSRREVPSVALPLAMGMWLWLTAWVSRLLVPLLGQSLIGGPQPVLELLVQGHVFAIVALVAVIGVGWAGLRTSADEPVQLAPFAAATVGGLGGWFVGQTVLFGSLLALPGATAAVLVASHAVEAVMLGSLIASLARRPVLAMGLGVGAQAAVLGLAWLALTLAS